MILFNIFKVIIGTYFQLSTGRFIANDNSLRMKLQCGDSSDLVNRTCDHLSQCKSVGVSIHHYQDLFRI